MAEGRQQVGEQLVEALAGVQALEQRIAKEEQEAERWAARLALAEGKEAPDLIEAARERVADHRRRAAEYRSEHARQQVYAAELEVTWRGSVAGPPRREIVIGDDDPVAHQLDKLERQEGLERELAELKQQLGRA